MTNKLLLFTVIALLLALSVLCVFCPVIASAETPSDELTPPYSTPFICYYYPNQDGIDDLLVLTDYAYKIGLFGGNIPFLTCYNNSKGYVTVYCTAVYQDNFVNRVPVDIYFNTSYTQVFVRFPISTAGAGALLLKYTLCINGGFNVEEIDTKVLTLNGDIPYIIMDETTGIYRQITTTDYPHARPADINTVDFGLGQIVGAYQRILDGYTVGGDGYDDGYTAGYDDGYDEGYGQGRTEGFDAGYDVGHDEGYETGYDDGYESGYDDGYETGYDDGFAHGVDTGKGLGYTEGYDDGYETGYWEGWDDGYDDGYERGEFDASPIAIDVPSVITSVPQSAKAIINNAFGFELFGINVAGLLSVLLIVAIIGFVVRWLMSR